MADLERVIPQHMRGWIPWQVWNPPPVLIQVTTADFGGEPLFTGFPSEFADYPEMLLASAGLYWRLTGIGKQTIENLDAEEVL